MAKQVSAVSAVALLIAPVAANSEDSPLKDYTGSYMCRPHGTAGFAYDEQLKEWQATTFDTSKVQRFVKFTALDDQTAGKTHLPPYRTYRVVINRADLPGLEAQACTSNLVPGLPPGDVPMFSDIAACKARSVDFQINFDNMSYQMIEDGGFLFDSPVITPYIQIGRCVRLD